MGETSNLVETYLEYGSMDSEWKIDPPAFPGLGEGDLRGRRRGGGEHGHCDTIKEENAKIPFGTLNYSIWDKSLIVSPFLESLIRSLGSWPH